MSRQHVQRTQRGQALVMTLLFGAVAGLAVLLMFNSALLVNTKSQLQNAADAGAYSAALLQARDHNFSAYTNRAMIANQVAVAQFVSLESYFEDAAGTSSRANNFLQNTIYRFFPSAAPAWDLAIKVPLSSVRSTVSSISKGAVVALDLLIDALDEAQQIHHLGTMAEMFVLSDEVVKKNDAQAKVTTSAFMVGDALVRVKNWGNDYTKRYAANDASAEADRFADAVVSDKSTDWFIRNRASIPLAAWASTVKPCLLASFTFTTYGFAHFGGTALSSDKRRWLALDATQGAGFWTCTWMVPCFTGLCPVTVGSPFVDVGTSAPFLGGSGGAQAGSGSGYSGNWKGYKNNPGAGWFYGYAMTSPAVVPANYRYFVKGPDATLDSNGGLQDHYRDVREPANAALKPKNQTPEENGGKFPVTVEIERPATSINTTAKLLPASNRLKLADGYKGNTMRSISSAHAYFYRSRVDDLNQFSRNGWRRTDGKTEYENLFSPYWQPRLTPSSKLEEAASLAAQ